MEMLNPKLQCSRLLNVLERKRLVWIFESIGHQKIIIVIAGAGYDKTIACRYCFIWD